MIDHCSVGVTDLERTRAVFDAALAPLDFGRVMDFADATGYRPPGKPCFWIAAPAGEAAPMPGLHIAFAAGSRDAVDRFHAAALTAGGADNGAPGLRPHYHPDYYAAFVTDPDGHHLEAVCHEPAGD